MSALDQIVNISIAQSTAAVPIASFSRTLIMGTSNKFASVTPTGTLDGSTNKITAVSSLTGVNVGATITGTGIPAHSYITAIQSPNIIYINANTTIGGSGVTLTITDVVRSYTGVAGMVTDGFATSDPEYKRANALMSQTLVPDLFYVGNYSAAASITAGLSQIQVQNDSWYGVALVSNVDADITNLATAIEGLTKIFIPVSNDADIPGSGSSDLASTMKASAYKRSALIYSIAGIAQGIEAAWLSQLVATPGSNNWAFKTLAGITADTLSSNAQANIIGVPESGTPGKNANIYQPVGGVNITQMGTMAGGQFIDITVGIDWLKANLQANIYSALVNASKIPYTDKGTGILISAVKQAIDQGVINGLIDGNTAISISAPSVLSVSANQRANRIAPTITFSCRLQGAFNAVIVQGTVTV